MWPIYPYGGIATILDSFNVKGRKGELVEQREVC